jgi:hypothetical protein
MRLVGESEPPNKQAAVGGGHAAQQGKRGVITWSVLSLFGQFLVVTWSVLWFASSELSFSGLDIRMRTLRNKTCPCGVTPDVPMNIS